MTISVWNFLELQILTFHIREGVSISEHRLIKQVENMDGSTKISRYMVRDVLQKLSQIGLIIQRPKSGTAVNYFDLNAKLFNLNRRISDEKLAVKELINRINDPKTVDAHNNVQVLVDEVKNMRLALNNPEPNVLDFFLADINFHSSIASLAGLPQYAEHIRGLYLITFLTTYSRRSLDTDIAEMILSQKNRFIEEHERILEAIQSLNSKEAEKLIQKHIMGCEDFWKLATVKSASRGNTMQP